MGNSGVCHSVNIKKEMQACFRFHAFFAVFKPDRSKKSRPIVIFSRAGVPNSLAFILGVALPLLTYAFIDNLYSWAYLHAPTSVVFNALSETVRQNIFGSKHWLPYLLGVIPWLLLAACQLRVRPKFSLGLLVGLAVACILFYMKASSIEGFNNLIDNAPNGFRHV